MWTRRRMRRAACWTGVGIGAVSLLALVAGIFGILALGSGARSIVLGRGAIALYWRLPGYVSASDPVLNPASWEGGWWLIVPRWQDPDPEGRTPYCGRVELPLWIPVGVGLVCLYLLLPTGPPAHTCECGYDLRAVPRVEGKVTCPECGRVRGTGGGLA